MDKYPNQDIAFAQMSSSFMEASALAHDIQYQNELHSSMVESDRLQYDEFKNAVASHLEQLQQDTFKNLALRSQVLPYEQLGHEHLRLEAGLQELNKNVVEATADIDVEKASIRAERDMIIQTLPELEPKLQELSLVLEDVALTAVRKAAVEKRTELEAKAIALQEVFSIAGEAWPIPALINTAEKLDVMKDEGEFILIDEFPDEPTDRSIEEITEDVRRNNPEERLLNASELIGLVMAEESGRIYTLDELGFALYGDDSKEDFSGSSRASALISNFERGECGVIGRTLQEYGLVFQRGLRKQYHKDGVRFGQSRAVYRAVTPQRAARLEKIVHSDELVEYVSDEWHTVLYDFEATNGTQDVDVTESAETKPAVSSIVSTEKMPALPIDTPISFDEVNTSEEEGPKPESKAKIWRDRLRVAVNTVIEQFSSDELMVDGQVSGIIIGLKTSQGSLISDRTYQRAVARGIIGKQETDFSHELPIHKFIAMAVQNAHPDFFESRRHRKQAMSLIERIVADYFKEQAKKV